SRPRRRSGVRAKDVGGETILYDTDREAIHVLNATAGVVWELCDGSHSVEEIAGRLAEAFEATDDAGLDVESDVVDVLATLAKRGLLGPAEESAHWPDLRAENHQTPHLAEPATAKKEAVEENRDAVVSAPLGRSEREKHFAKRALLDAGSPSSRALDGFV
ncbi:MAG: PqqD family protein, partial [bacterium]|nr:PqqD family protein [bacterium]